jgi:hypothetical protein
MITKEFLHEMFEYKNGILYRKKSAGIQKIGDVAGHLKNDTGYITIRVDGKYHAAHRLIWMMHYGEFPKLIDHIDGNRNNNLLSNLRSTDRFGNAQNRKLHKNNTSGAKGVLWNKQTCKWTANVISNRKRRFLGYFDSFEDADEFACLARDMLHGEYANHGNDTQAETINALTARIVALEGA